MTATTTASQSDDVGRTFFVEAGAGAGKTSALVARVVALVEAGTPVTAIAAITFTESAAAELRDRVRHELEVRAGQGDELAAVAVADVDDAPISTLHAFAQRVLAAHAIEANLPAVIDVRDEVDAAIAFDQEWAVFFDGLVSDLSLRDTLGACLLLGLQERHFRALARVFDDSWDLLVGSPFAPTGLRGAAAPSVDLAPLRSRLRELDGAADGCRDPEDKLCGHLREVVFPLAGRLGRADDLLGKIEALADSAPLRAGNKGQAASWRAPTKAELVAALEEAEVERQAALTGVRGGLLLLVAEEIRRFTLERAQRRRVDGALEFHDLLVHARDVLRSHPAVLTSVRASFAYVLIDEFQDTDPLQAEIALLLGTASPAATHPRAVAGPDADPGRLFFVGDPKQSIYRFRRADMATYTALRTAFSRDLVPLATNYRSTRDVVRWINAVFAAMLDGVDGQAPWADLIPVRRSPRDAGPPVVTFGAAAAPREPVASLREREAEDIVALVQRAVGDPWRVADDASGDELWRPARLDDIAILLPTRTSLPAIERALDRAGIPSRIESRSLLWATQEARELLAVLRAIDDPSDQVAVVAALRSPALACSDRDLLDAVTSGFRWDKLDATGLPPDSPVRVALDRLEALRAQRWSQPFTALVEQVVRDLRFLELGLAGPKRREAWSRVRFVVDQARAFADRGRGATLRAFLDWAERQADEKARVMETVVPERDNVAVRITTIHAAKGREFPIVIVAGLSVEGEPWRDASVLWHDEPQVRLARNDLGWTTADWDEARSTDQWLDRLEEDRLAYVACTRARDHLCVSLYHRPPTANRSSIAARLDGAAGVTGRRVDIAGLPLVLALGPIVAGVVQEGPGSERATRPVDAVHAWSRRRKELLASGARRAAWTATKLAAHEPSAATAEALGRDSSGGLLAPRQASSGAAIGTAVHAVLQRVDLDGDGAEIDELAQSFAFAGSLAGGDADPAQADVIARLARSAWAAPSVRAAATTTRRWREVYVGAVTGDAGRIVEGYIDLLYEGADGLVIVDYKTDAAGDDELDPLLDRYRLQLAAYALAVQLAVPESTVSKAVLVVARAAGPAIELTLEGAALVDAIQQVGAVGAASGAAGAP